MTDQELDRMLRRALLDAADQEAQTPPETETPLSEGHRRRMREMLRDPLLWFRLRNPYPWRTVARRAAVVLLMLSLSAAMVLAVSPKARADIVRWTMEQDGRRVEFRYHGDGPAQALPQYRIVALPEGYTETERIAYDSFGSCAMKTQRVMPSNWTTCTCRMESVAGTRWLTGMSSARCPYPVCPECCLFPRKKVV